MKRWWRDYIAALGYCHQLDQQYQEHRWKYIHHKRSSAAMVESENEWCFVCVEDHVAEESRVL